jgi:competence ComEA-like helix-hairpin-helix protein
LVLLAILLPAFVCAAALVDINTADATLLDTLPGIGPSKAVAIVDYRTQHGPFVRIEDIQNVSGIGPSTYAGIAPFITVGNVAASEPLPTASSTQNVSTSSGGSTTYTPPPTTLSVDISGSRSAISEVPLHVSARAMVKGGAVDSSAQISWGFGDGSFTTGTAVEKIYRYAGTYLVTVTATDGSTVGRGEIIVTVRPAKVRLIAVSGDGITIANDSSERLDLSGWRLLSDVGSFRIPDGTSILPEASVLFPFTITNLPIALDVTLLYPNGIIAARFVPPTPQVGTAVQLSEPNKSFNNKQTVESAPNTSVSGTAHEITAVGAPTAATDLAAVGATLSSVPPTTTVRVLGLFRSPWTLGLLGIIAMAGGAFILL